MKNKFNLSRDIPSEVAREVRKNCGFGCAICGSAFYHYDHYDPEFNEAMEHNAAGITLLCAEHHDAKSRGRLSKETVSNAALNPKCMKVGFSYGPLEIGNKSIIVQIGSTIFIKPKNIICINGEPILSIKPPEEKEGPFLLTLVTEDSHMSNRIVDNEWIGDALSWDIKTEGRKIIVKDHQGLVVLDIENIPKEKFIIHHINIAYRSYRISTNKISQKKIGSIIINEEKIITISNSQGREIARIGNQGDNFNEITWDNALEVIDDFMNANLENVNLKGGNINLLRDDRIPLSLIGNTFTDVSISLGINKQVSDFVNEANLLSKQFNKVKWNKQKIDPRKRSQLKNQYKMLIHNHLLNQLTLQDRTSLAYFIKKI